MATHQQEDPKPAWFCSKVPSCLRKPFWVSVEQRHIIHRPRAAGDPSQGRGSEPPRAPTLLFSCSMIPPGADGFGPSVFAQVTRGHTLNISRLLQRLKLCDPLDQFGRGDLALISSTRSPHLLITGSHSSKLNS